jgi:hypothetical protein
MWFININGRKSTRKGNFFSWKASMIVYDASDSQITEWNWFDGEVLRWQEPPIVSFEYINRRIGEST